jgi:uncharacterized protein YktB (UPF0637 family)
VESQVRIRNYEEKDFAQVKALHEAMGLDYRMPDLQSPLFIIRQVAELDGKIVAVGAAKIETELYMWLNRSVGDPETRWDAVRQLNESVMDEAHWSKGIDNCVCWVPKEVEKSFAKRLSAMGFKPDRDGWHSWSRPTKI